MSSRASELVKKYKSLPDGPEKQAVKAEIEAYKAELQSGKNLSNSGRAGYYTGLSKKKEVREVPATLDGEMRNDIKILNRLKSIKEYVQSPHAEENLGPWHSRFNAVGEFIGVEMPEYTRALAGIGLTPQEIQKVLTGTGAGVREAQKFERSLPSQDKTPEENKIVTDSLMQQQLGDLETRMQVMEEQGYDVSPYRKTLQGVLSEQNTEQKDPVSDKIKELREKAQQRLQNKQSGAQ